MLHDPVNLLVVDVLRRTSVVGFIIANICSVNDYINCAIWFLKVAAEVFPFSTSSFQSGFIETLFGALPTSLKF